MKRYLFFTTLVLGCIFFQSYVQEDNPHVLFANRYDSRVKAMEVDERPTEQYSDIGGLDKQIQEVVTLYKIYSGDLFIPWVGAGYILLVCVCLSALLFPEHISDFFHIAHNTSLREYKYAF